MIAQRALRQTALGALLLLSAHVQAQQGDTKRPIGMLWTDSPEASPLFIHAFQKGLSELSYIDGKNIRIVHRSARGGYEHLLPLAKELLAEKVDVIVTVGTPAAVAARQATATLPIVMAISGDPIAQGLISSLSRPGGNVTGLTILAPELNAKRLELLREIVPGRANFAAIVDRRTTTSSGEPLGWNDTRAAAARLGLQLLALDVHDPSELERAFQRASDAGAAGILLLSSPILTYHSRAIVSLAGKHRLPVMFTQAAHVRAGGLVSYGPDAADLVRRSASYVAKILNGAKPADLPVEQPTKFQLAVNLKTAKALGLTMPESILVQAHEVIE